MIEIKLPKAYKNLFCPMWRYQCYYGGRGGAKSESIARGLLLVAGSSKKRILCTREYQNSINESVHKLLKRIIEDYKLAGFTVTKDSIRHRNGSEFIFKGLQNIGSIKSIDDIDICWVEEAQYLSAHSLKILLPSIRAEGSQIWFSFNREEEEDPVWEELCENPDELTLVQKVNWYDNPYFPNVLESERQRCLKNKPDDYGHVWEGEPVKHAGGLVIKNFVEDKNYKVGNVRPIAYQPDMDLHITCDFNVDPMCWILAHKHNGKIYFFDEIVLEDTTTTKCIEEFHNRYPLHTGKIIINGDASGKNRSTQSEYHNYKLMMNKLSSFGYRDVELKLRRGNPRISHRITAWNEKIVDLDGERCIIISPKCKWLLYNCKKLKYQEGSSTIKDPSPKEIEKDRNKKFLVHPFDAASYLVDYYFPIKRDYKPLEDSEIEVRGQNNFEHILKNRG